MIVVPSSTPAPAPAPGWLTLCPPPTPASPLAIHDHSSYTPRTATLPVGIVAVDEHQDTAARWQGGSTPLPASSCYIEALREALLPLYYRARTRKRSQQHRVPQANNSIIIQVVDSHDKPMTTSRKRKAPDYALEEGDVARAVDPEFVVSNARTSELVEILGLHQSTLPLSFPLTFFLPILLNDNFIILTAKSKTTGKVVGCISAHLEFHHHSSGERSRRRVKSVQILTLCVDGKYRRKGLALRLLSDLTSRIRSSPSSPIDVTLHVQTSNTPAMQLYESVGFSRPSSGARKVGHYRGTGCRWGSLDAWEMVKVL